ncbi:ABC transporter substrate-binding protein [Ruegeria halocynthiae]|uniref:ABC transporter substrate-binding protein n=1 Tax=Ruegeria halocynthiae TaxID=985054 RepID=UPI000B28890D|nr:ABC transporter substrate-binding protein [Ruegeria halocynthiae]
MPEFHQAQVRATEQMRSNARKSILVIHHSKFGRHAPAAGADLSGIDQVVCDRLPQGAFSDLVKGLGNRIVCAEKVDKILAGYGTVGNDTPINAAYPLFEPIAQRSYDPDKARHHFGKSGYDGDIVLRVSDAAFPGATDAAALFQQSAKAAGIDLQIVSSPADGYWEEVWNVQPFSAAYWLGTPTQNQTFTLTYMSTSNWNDSRFQNPRFDQLITEAAGTLDQQKRQEMYHEAAFLVHGEGGLINPMFNNFIDGYRDDMIAGWVDHPAGEMMWSRAAVNCWQI